MKVMSERCVCVLACACYLIFTCAWKLAWSCVCLPPSSVAIEQEKREKVNLCGENQPFIIQ